jgi:heme/copper-type cytochrome/quinol oxidase subunit 4
MLDKVFQTIADFTMTHTGKSSYWVAAQLFLFNTVICLVDLGYRLMIWMDSGRDQTVFNHYVVFGAIITPLIILGNHMQYRWCEKQEREFQDNQLGNYVNERRATNMVIRILFLVICLIDPIFWFVPNPPDEPAMIGFLGSLFIFSAGAALYFQSCTPRPPARSHQTRLATSLG